LRDLYKLKSPASNQLSKRLVSKFISQVTKAMVCKWKARRGVVAAFAFAFAQGRRKLAVGFFRECGMVLGSGGVPSLIK
jgi:hypothetical protein